MRKVNQIQGRALPLLRANVDTDLIIPKQFLKTVSREGLGKGLFYDLRFDENGVALNDSLFNDPVYSSSKLLLAGRNFGCGSSREHAPWALLDFGFEAVIAPDFADIFFNNSSKNGLLLIQLPESEIHRLAEEAQTSNGKSFQIDLPAQTILTPHGRTVSFEIEPYLKEKLMAGFDDIELTKRHADEITAFAQRHSRANPWLVPGARL